MRVRIPAVLVLALCAAPSLHSAPPKLTFSPASPKPGELVMVVADGPAKFKLPDGVIVFNSGDGKGVVFPLPEGGCTVLAAPTDPAPLADVATVEIGRGAPKPPAPVPPGPNPVPPGPSPTPTPSGQSPFTEPGFRVLIVIDPKKTMPAAQYGAIYGEETDKLLRQVCVKEAGGNPGRRIWPSDANPVGDLKVWQDAFKRPAKSLPWVMIGDGKTGYEGPVTTAAELQSLIRKYAGVAKP